MKKNAILSRDLPVFIGGFAAFFSFILPGVALGGESVGGLAETIDLRPVVRLNGHEVSAYVMEKNLNRYAHLAVPGATKPDGDNLANGRKLFVAQQIVIEEASRLGYLDRTSVVETVSRMERYMLTQTSGPFYETLYRKLEPGSDERPALYAKSARIYDLIIVRFSDLNSARTTLGTGFKDLPVLEKQIRLAACCGNPVLLTCNGRMVWPFGPFSECAGALEKISDQQFLDEYQTPTGIFFAYVRKTEPRPFVATDSDREAFFQSLSKIRQLQLLRERRARLLADAQFSINQSVLDRMVHKLEGERIIANQFPLPALEEFGNEPLFSYLIDGSARQITVNEFALQFNQRMVRSIRLAPENISESARDTVMEELDLREARQREIDQTPKFKEDRENFRRYQALDLYEREKILPEIAISETAIADYYAEHQKTFAQPKKVAVRKLFFPDKKAAADFASLTMTGQTKAGEGPAAAALLVVARETPIQGLEYLTDTILMSSPGTVLGPIEQQDGKTTVLVRDETVESTIPVLTQVSPQIKSRLERSAMDQRELTLAAEFRKTISVEDLTDQYFQSRSIDHRAAN